jgi:ribonuclease P protein component
MTAMDQADSALRRLKKRSQFVRAARGNRAGRSAFGLQAISAREDAPGIGFTVTKKSGNSPERNRIKRRLRAAVTACADDFMPSHDYVLVGRREALNQPFDRLVADLAFCIARVHGTKSADKPHSSGRAGHRNTRP